MQFLTNTKFPFLAYRKPLMVMSVIAIIASFVLVFVLKSLNYGIDFKGGTQIVVKLRTATSSDQLRNALAAAGIADAQLQQYGKPEDQEFLIRVPLVEKAPSEVPVGSESAEEGRSKEVIAALDATFNPGNNRTDLNQRGSLQISQMLANADPDGKKALGVDQAATHYETVANTIIAERKKVGLFTDWSQVGAGEGVSPAVVSYLQGTSVLGNMQIVSNESVGAAIGKELRTKGVWAVVFALLAMMVYIWFRFELRFGIGALVASFHDVVVTLGLFALLDYEFNLSTIAAFLTLVGYSINDTVVIFDRVRENMRRHRRLSLEEIMNLSVNETLPRSIMTAGTTLVACAALYFFGGEVLKGFSFVMLVGVIVGTYSSVFIASPFALWWDSLQDKNKAADAAGKAAKA